METKVEELYEQVVKPLPAAERLKLAKFILNDIPPQAVVDVPYDWEEQDEATEMAAWRALSAKVNRQVWDNSVDSADWDKWQPQSKPNRKTKVRSGK